MDTSRSSTARLATIKGVAHLKSEPTPHEVAQLLFNELYDLDGLGRGGLAAGVIQRGASTGVSIEYGRETLPWSDLELPSKFDAVGIMGVKLEEAALRGEWGTNTKKFGCLLIARDKESPNEEVVWLWVQRWRWHALCGEDVISHTKLSLEGLAELMTPSENGRATLVSPRVVYEKYTQMLVRQTNWYQAMERNVVLLASRSQDRLKRMEPPH